jgi:hypothetical protein
MRPEDDEPPEPPAEEAPEPFGTEIVEKEQGEDE